MSNHIFKLGEYYLYKGDPRQSSENNIYTSLKVAGVFSLFFAGYLLGKNRSTVKTNPSSNSFLWITENPIDSHTLPDFIQKEETSIIHFSNNTTLSSQIGYSEQLKVPKQDSSDLFANVREKPSNTNSIAYFSKTSQESKNSSFSAESTSSAQGFEPGLKNGGRSIPNVVDILNSHNVNSSNSSEKGGSISLGVGFTKPAVPVKMRSSSDQSCCESGDDEKSENSSFATISTSSGQAFDPRLKNGGRSIPNAVNTLNSNNVNSSNSSEKGGSISSGEGFSKLAFPIKKRSFSGQLVSESGDDEKSKNSSFQAILTSLGQGFECPLRNRGLSIPNTNPTNGSLLTNFLLSNRQVFGTINGKIPNQTDIESFSTISSCSSASTAEEVDESNYVIIQQSSQTSSSKTTPR